MTGTLLITLTRVQRLHIGLEYLRQARDQIRYAQAPNAANAVRRAMKSTEGALRHAERLPVPAGRRASRKAHHAAR